MIKFEDRSYPIDFWPLALSEDLGHMLECRNWGTDQLLLTDFPIPTHHLGLESPVRSSYWAPDGSNQDWDRLVSAWYIVCNNSNSKLEIINLACPLMCHVVVIHHWAGSCWWWWVEEGPRMTNKEHQLLFGCHITFSNVVPGFSVREMSGGGVTHLSSSLSASMAMALLLVCKMERGG